MFLSTGDIDMLRLLASGEREFNLFMPANVLLVLRLAQVRRDERARCDMISITGLGQTVLASFQPSCGLSLSKASAASSAGDRGIESAARSTFANPRRTSCVATPSS
jgi:hypothetical protein